MMMPGDLGIVRYHLVGFPNRRDSSLLGDGVSVDRDTAVVIIEEWNRHPFFERDKVVRLLTAKGPLWIQGLVAGYYIDFDVDWGWDP